jgi:hypothetical protein
MNNILDFVIKRNPPVKKLLSEIISGMNMFQAINTINI